MVKKDRKYTKIYKRYKGVEKNTKRLTNIQNIQIYKATPQKDTKDTNIQSDPQKYTVDTKYTSLYPIFVSDSVSTKKDTSTSGILYFEFIKNR